MSASVISNTVLVLMAVIAAMANPLAGSCCAVNCQFGATVVTLVPGYFDSCGTLVQGVECVLF